MPSDAVDCHVGSGDQDRDVRFGVLFLMMREAVESVDRGSTLQKLSEVKHRPRPWTVSVAT